MKRCLLGLVLLLALPAGWGLWKLWLVAAERPLGWLGAGALLVERRLDAESVDWLEQFLQKTVERMVREGYLRTSEGQPFNDPTAGGERGGWCQPQRTVRRLQV